jgi:PilZ domain-containing protein
VVTVGSHMSDRRRSLRASVHYHGRVRTVDVNGDKFKTDVTVDNMSAGGLYLRLPREVRQGSQTCVALRLSTDLADVSRKSVVAMRGVALRGEPKSDGTWGIAVAFTRYRVL